MEKELGRFKLADGSTLIRLEESLPGDFGMKQIFKTLRQDGLPLDQEVSSEPSPTETPAEIAELTPGQAILHIATKQIDPYTLLVQVTHDSES